MSKRSKFAQQLAEGFGLSVNGQTNVVYGNYRGYTVLFTPVSGTIYTLSLSVTGQDEGELRRQIKEIPKISHVKVSGNAVTIEFKRGSRYLENIQEAMSGLVQALVMYGYRNCCSKCGQQKETVLYQIEGQNTALCEDCYETLRSTAAIKKEQLAAKRENVAGGIVGAILGSLIGVAVMIILSQLGYVAALSGGVMAVCALKGYELLGGKLTGKGIVLSLVIMIAMIYFGNQLDWAIAIAQETDFEIDIFTAFRSMSYFLKEEWIDKGYYYRTLVMEYGFALLGAIPTIIGEYKSNKLKNTASKMGE